MACRLGFDKAKFEIIGIRFLGGSRWHHLAAPLTPKSKLSCHRKVTPVGLTRLLRVPRFKGDRSWFGENAFYKNGQSAWSIRLRLSGMA